MEPSRTKNPSAKAQLLVQRPPLRFIASPAKSTFGLMVLQIQKKKSNVGLKSSTGEYCQGEFVEIVEEDNKPQEFVPFVCKPSLTPEQTQDRIVTIQQTLGRFFLT